MSRMPRDAVMSSDSGRVKAGSAKRGKLKPLSTYGRRRTAGYKDDIMALDRQKVSIWCVVSVQIKLIRMGNSDC